MKHWLICVRQADKNLPLLQLTFIHNGVVERSYERWGLVVGICDSDGHCSCGSLLWTASISGNYLLKHANKCACITHTHTHTHTQRSTQTHIKKHADGLQLFSSYKIWNADWNVMSSWVRIPSAVWDTLALTRACIKLGRKGPSGKAWIMPPIFTHFMDPPVIMLLKLSTLWIHLLECCSIYRLHGPTHQSVAQTTHFMDPPVRMLLS